MKQSYFTDVKTFLIGNDLVRRFTFKTKQLWDNCAQLAVVCPIFAAYFELQRGKSALLHKTDCFECPSPLYIAA